MTIFLYWSAIIAAFFGKKSKLVAVYILSVIWVLAAFNLSNADLTNYQREYAWISEGIFTAENARYLGYYFLQLISSKIGLDFLSFKVLVFLGVFLLLAYSLRKITKNFNIALAFYLAYSYGIDVVQVKTLIANTLVFFAIANFLSKKESSNYDKIIFILLLVLASSFHFANSFFLIIGILYIFFDAGLYKKICLFGSIGFILLTRFNILEIIFNLSTSILTFAGDLNYLSGWFDSRVKLGFFLQAAPVVALLFLNHMHGRLQKREKNELIGLDNMLAFSWGILLLLPFFMYDVTFSRLCRVFYLVHYALLAQNFTVKWDKKGMKIAAFFLSISLVVFLYLLDIQPVYPVTLGAIFDNNMYLQ